MKLVANDENFIPNELRLLWDESFTARQPSGLTSLRGYYYQYLYSLELAKELLKPKPHYQAYACEWLEDFLAWGQNPNGTLKRVLLVQVKTSLTGCFLSSGGTAKVFANFQTAIDRLLPELNDSTEIKCRLVYNAHANHDCRCLERIRKRPSHRLLMRRIGRNRTDDPIEFVPFLQIPISRKAILAQLEFLNDHQPAFTSLLDSEKDLIAFVRTVYGLITPFYTPRSEVSFSEDHGDELRLGTLHRDKIHTLDDFSNALQTVMTMRKRALKDNRDRIHEFSKRQARKDFETAYTPRAEGPVKTRGINFTDKDLAKDALAIIHTLSTERHSMLFHVDQFTVMRKDDFVRLEVPPSDAVPVSEYLRRKDSTHRERLKLVLSFVRAVIGWAKRGVLLTDFRGDMSQYQQLYLAGPGSQFIMGDLGALTLSSNKHRLLDEKWIPGPLLGKACRFLYYGKTRRRDIENTRLYRARWNDNIIRDLSRWLDSMPFIDAQDLHQTLEFVFKDELEGSPIFFSGIDEQFIKDTIDSGFKSTSDVLTESRPNYLSEDRGHWKYPLVYTSWRDAQIGSFEESPNVLTLYRYSEYGTKRSASARDRDWGRALQMQELPDRDRILSVFCHQSDISDVCSKVFGISYPDYVNWLGEQKYGAKHVPQNVLPPLLMREKSLFLYRQGRLDSLRNKRFKFKLVENKFRHDLSSNVVTLRIGDGLKILDHVNELGYQPKTLSSLSVICGENAGLKITAPLFQLRRNESPVVMEILPPPTAELLPQSGYLHLTDIGTARVMRDEDSVFREFEFYLTCRDTFGREIPTGRAWEWLEPIFGRDRPHIRSGKEITNGDCDFKTNDQLVEDVLRSILEGKKESHWHVLTGAAGTGKTHVTASIALQYLEATKTREFPPRRVLVVSAAHFGVDNFVRVFLRTSEGRYMPYRFITENRLLALKRAGVIDEQLYESSKQYYEAISNDLPSPKPKSYGRPTFLTQQHALESHLSSVNQKRNSQKQSMLTPSHEQWRAAFGNKQWFGPNELMGTRHYLATKAKQLKLYRENAETHDRSQLAPPVGLYSLFASEMIATTVDAFDRLPDMSFDLIVVEEASQLGLLKLLKVLTKVARSRDPELPPPAIILSGDQRQLPPFLEQIQLDGSYEGVDKKILKELSPEARRDVETYQDFETAFETICRRHPKRILPLTTQYRMQSQIALVVNKLFYRDQNWVMSRNDRGSGVVWIDTSALKARFVREKGGTSRYNEAEINIVTNLVANLTSDKQVEADEILVVSPYLAQVSKLEDALVGIPGVKVRTIDGCQGIEAATVIVSFVSLTFAPGNDFVVNSKRLNVALSRARDSLYLIGNFTELEDSVRRYETHQYGHVGELVKLFGQKGLLRNKRMPARY